MPVTIENSVEEYDVLTDEEVAPLVAAFEAASAALDAFDAVNPMPAYVSRADEGYEAYAAQYEEIKARRGPLESAKAAANRALSESKNVPVGTVVRFITSAGWDGNDLSEGVIVKVTNASYVVDKSSGGYSGGTARLDRAHAHKYRSYYGGGKARSMSVVRTASQQRGHVDQEAAKRRTQMAQREAEQALHAAREAAEQAQRKQAAILREARSRALDVLVKRHKAEFEGLEMTALDVLAADAPGREESTFPAPKTT